MCNIDQQCNIANDQHDVLWQKPLWGPVQYEAEILITAGWGNIFMFGRSAHSQG